VAVNKVDGGRRAFLRGALLTREGRNAETARQQPLGPPPPWHQGLAGRPHPGTRAWRWKKTAWAARIHA